MTLRQILLVLVLLTVTAVRPTGAAVSSSQHVLTVPNVVGLTLSDAKKAIDKAGLDTGRVSTQASATVATGRIVSESPIAGTHLKNDDTKVNLVVSSGASKVTMPNVVGLTQAAATTALTGAGLTLGSVTTQASAPVAVGLVLSESPTAGSSVASGSAVGLVLSSGPPLVLVPNVVGLTQAAASTALTGAALTLGSITTQSSATVASGLVLSESPVAGTSVAAQSAVNLVLSSGAVIPNVVGQTQAFATTAFTGAGLTLGSVTMQASATVGVGLVISESPAAGTSVVAGSAINLVVSSGTASAIAPTIDPSVPAAASGQITAFYSPTTTVPVGGLIPTFSDGSVTLLFAGDGVNDPLLLAVGSTTGALDADTTAVGLVRLALGLVFSQASPSTATLTSLIQASPNYAALLSSVNAALAAGQPPIDAPAVVQAAWVVANAVHASYQAPAAGIAKAAATIVVAPPLPFYLINSIETTNQVFLNDVVGTNSANVMNQTFIAWQLSSTDPNGVSLDSQTALPLVATSLQLLGSYSGSASQTTVAGAAPEFTLTLAQNDTTRVQNILNTSTRMFLMVWSALTNLYPNETQYSCVQGGVSQALNSTFPVLLTQPSGAAALQYLNNAGFGPAGWANLNNVVSVLQPCITAPSITALANSTIGRLWQLLNLATSATAAFGTPTETSLYWNYSQDFQICKFNGTLVSCTAPSLVGTYQLVSMRGGLCIVGGAACDPAAGLGNYCITSGLMTITATGSWSYSVNATLPCVTGTVTTILANNGRLTGVPSYLTAALEADNPVSVCPTLGDYLGNGAYCTEYPAGYYYYPIGISGGTSSVAADPTGMNLISNFGGDTVWVRSP